MWSEVVKKLRVYLNITVFYLNNRRASSKDFLCWSLSDYLNR